MKTQRKCSNFRFLISELRHENQVLKKKHVRCYRRCKSCGNEITQAKLSILKIEGQLKRVLFEKKLIWEDIGRVLGKFISEELDLN